MTAALPCPPLPWRLFEPEGRWWTTELWHHACSLAADHVPVARAEEALRHAFPEHWVHGERAASQRDRWDRVLWDLRHPFARHFGSNAAPLLLLELGWALSEVKRPAAYYPHLRHPGEFDGAAFELWTRLLLAHAGAHIERVEDPGKKSPDWLAAWASGSAAVECKVLSESAWQRRRSDAALEVATIISERLRGLEEGVQLPGPLSVQIAPEAIESATHCPTARPGERGIDGARLRALAVEIGDAMIAALSEVRATGSAKRGGLFEASVLPPMGACNLHVAPAPEDREHELRRLRDTVTKAAGQLRAVEAPGVVMVDVQWDRWLSMYDHFQDVGSMLRADARCYHVGLVLLRVVFPGRAQLPHNKLYSIPGPAFENLPSELLRALRRCPSGTHFHFDPMLPGDVSLEECWP